MTEPDPGRRDAGEPGQHPAADPGAGPGVFPPFVAPPREGSGRRLGVAFAIGGVVAFVCCGGGIASFIEIAAAANDQAVSGARAAVTTYMTDWQRQDYAGAYQQLCTDIRDSTTPAALAQQLDEDQLRDFVVEDVQPEQGDVEVTVRAEFSFGGTRRMSYAVAVDADGSSKVCSY